MNLFERLSLSIEKYHGLAIIFSILALAVSLLAVFANGRPNVLKSDSARVSIPNKIYLSQYLGRFSATIPVSIVNTGGDDIQLRDAKFLFEKDGKTIIDLHSESYMRSGESIYLGGTGIAGFPLTDVLVKPGASWSGNVLFSEPLDPELDKEINRLQTQFHRESRKKSKMMQEMAYRGLEKLASVSLKDALTTAATAVSGLTGNKCDAAPSILGEAAKKITDKGLNRLVTGSYLVKFELYDSAKTLHTRDRQLILYDQQINALQDEDGVSSTVCGSISDMSSSTAYSQYRLPQTGVNLEFQGTGNRSK